jgi:hypothetical protein
MNIDSSRLLTLLYEQVRLAASDAVEKCARSTGKTGMPSQVSIVLKIAHDKKSPHVIALTSTLKIREPKSSRVHLTAASEPEELVRWDTGEEQGQERIPT